jgi:hypothetical protein
MIKANSYLPDRNHPRFLETLVLGKRCVEVGVQLGQYSQVLLNGRPKELYLVDCWQAQSRELYQDPANVSQAEQDRKYNEVLKRFLLNQRVRIIRHWSTAAALLFPDKSLDFVYLDANHSLIAVNSDIEAWWPKLKAGGCLAGHDYGVPRFQVTQAVDQFVRRLGKSQLDIGTRPDKKTHCWGVLKP